MNLQTHSVLEPLRVLMFNALSTTAKLLTAKILNGVVFGEFQLIDFIIVVYSNEIEKAVILKGEIEACSFSCTNSIKISSDLPNVSDGDVFCFITNFSNPNVFDFENVDTEERFDTMYLISKIANNFVWPDVPNMMDVEGKPREKLPMELQLSAKKAQKRKPIFIADGLIAVDILYSLSKNMPSDVFFCFTPLTAMGKIVLAEYLNVNCKTINEMQVWAANDEVFYIEVDKPTIVRDDAGDTTLCDPNVISKASLESLNLDPTQFNATWMKKDFQEKVATFASKNPYGCIYKAAEFAKSLRDIWATRRPENEMKAYSCNMGVISDGSLGTEKALEYPLLLYERECEGKRFPNKNNRNAFVGLPLVLPIVFDGELWSVSRKNIEDNTHLKQEMKRINATAKKHHKMLITHCKKFLEENVINQAFIPSDVDSGSMY